MEVGSETQAGSGGVIGTACLLRLVDFSFDSHCSGFAIITGNIKKKILGLSGEVTTCVVVVFTRWCWMGKGRGKMKKI